MKCYESTCDWSLCFSNTYRDKVWKSLNALEDTSITGSHIPVSTPVDVTDELRYRALSWTRKKLKWHSPRIKRYQWTDGIRRVGSYACMNVLCTQTTSWHEQPCTTWLCYTYLNAVRGTCEISCTAFPTKYVFARVTKVWDVSLASRAICSSVHRTWVLLATYQH